MASTGATTWNERKKISWNGRQNVLTTDESVPFALSQKASYDNIEQRNFYEIRKWIKKLQRQ